MKKPQSLIERFKEQPLTRGDVTPEFAKAAIEAFGCLAFAARALQPYCVNSIGAQPAWRSVEGWFRDGLRGSLSPRPSERPERVEAASRVIELLDKGRQDIGDIDIKGVEFSSWGGLVKGPDGKPITVPLHATRVLGKPKELSASQYIKGTIPSIPAIKVPKSAKPKRAARTGFVTGDWQVGYYRDPRTQTLDPFHDESAIAAMFAVVRHIKPDFGILNGDIGDFAPLSRFPQYSGYHNTMDLGIRRVREGVGQTRYVAGDNCDLYWNDGNHEQRLIRMLIEKAPGLQDISIPGSDADMHSSRAVFDLDKAGFVYNPPFPGEKMMLAPLLGVQHRKHPAKQTQFDSIIHGDDHHLYVHATTIHDSKGSRYIYDASAGCLCRIENMGHQKPYRPLRSWVPSASVNHDWQQGFIVVTIQKDGTPLIETVPIVRGVAFFRGQAFRGEVRKGVAR